MKRIIQRKQSRPRRRSKNIPTSTRVSSRLSRQLQDLRDQIDIVLTEMTARVAALEHVLLEKQLCTHADLRHAREFVRLQEA